MLTHADPFSARLDITLINVNLLRTYNNIVRYDITLTSYTKVLLGF